MENVTTRYQAIAKKEKESKQHKMEMLKLVVAENICRYMAIHKISRTELADRLGTSKAYITKILRGTSNLTLESLLSLSTSLGCDLHIQFCEMNFLPCHMSVFTNPRRHEDFNEQAKGIDKIVDTGSEEDNIEAIG